jgi:hypothetical protein
MRLTGRIATGLLLLALGACADTREDSFAALSTAEGQSMVSRGWIPSVLPSSATDVRVRTNIDTNMVRGVARIPVGDLARLRAALTPASDDVAPPFCPKGSATPPWWPSELRPPGRPSDLRRLGWELFSVPGRDVTYIALRQSDGCVYFWAESS